jgi:predicted  nucleic acid-binding Zn-ribbon protein
MPCGHRKIDWDDSYGECVACQYKRGYWDNEKEHEQLLDKYERESRENDKLRQQLAAAQDEAERWKSDYLMTSREIQDLFKTFQGYEAAIKKAREKAFREAESIVFLKSPAAAYALKVAIEKESE